MRTRPATLVVALATFAVLAAPAGASTFTVTNTADSGAGSLLDAITQANAQDAGTPHTITFALPSATTIDVPADLPAITRSGTMIDGCNVGRSPLQTPNAPGSPPCVGLRGTGAATGLAVTAPSSVAIQGLALTGFATAIHLRGTDSSRIAGNRFGIGIDGTTSQANDVGIRITGETLAGALVDSATMNIIGGPPAPASATNGDDAVCDAYCNLIGNSTVAGIDLVGTATPSGTGDAPAGGPAGDFSQGTTIAGNWIGVETKFGDGAPNATAINVGGAHATFIGATSAGGANVIAGNAHGVDQGTGTDAITILHGVFGLSPNGDSAVPNGAWNARLHGSAADSALVQDATFGPSQTGLQLDGPKAAVIGSVFASPDATRFTQAAIALGESADDVQIGAAPVTFPVLSSMLGFCMPLVSSAGADFCNWVSDTAPGKPGIWIRGADRTSIQRTGIGSFLDPPLDGPPIRVEGAGANTANGTEIGGDVPAQWNSLIRTSGPAIEIGAGASGVAVSDNVGIVPGTFAAPGSLFVDVLPAPGPGNTSGSANAGVQPPVITTASTSGIAGTAEPGATVRILQQEAPDPPGQPSDGISEGTTFPTSPSMAVADGSGVWQLAFDSALTEGQKLEASQTVAGKGSSEYAVPQGAAQAPDLPTVQFTSAPIGTVTSPSAVFSFVSTTPGATFECSLDGTDFSACASPLTVGPLEAGGHQLRVRGRLAATVGLPVSRSWEIELVGRTAAPGVISDVVNASSTVRFAALVTLPAAGRCVSRRLLRVRLKRHAGVKVASVQVFVNGHRTKTVRGAALAAPVDLRGLPKGRVVVKLRVTLSSGRILQASRTYRTCAAKKTKRRR